MTNSPTLQPMDNEWVLERTAIEMSKKGRRRPAGRRGKPAGLPHLFPTFFLNAFVSRANGLNSRSRALVHFRLQVSISVLCASLVLRTTLFADSELLLPPSGRVDMVLDADMYNEVDDQFALAFAVRSPEKINLKAVCAAPFKNHRSNSPGDGMEKSYHESIRVMKLLNVPSEGLVFRGSDQYLTDRTTPVDRPAARRMIKLAHEPREGPLYVVGLGAASNLASALLMDPSITNHVVMVWIGGQPHDWKSAHDFNLRQDIAAAQVLFDSGVPLVHVPADVARALAITLPELEDGLKGKSVIADALYSNVDEYYFETVKDKGTPRSGSNAWRKVIWDIATIAWLLEGDAMAASELVPSPVLSDKGEWGVGTDRHDIRVVTELDRERIYEVVFKKLAE